MLEKKCNLQNGAMLEVINNASLHHANQGGKGAKKLLQIFHSLLVMKNIATSTSALTTRILAAKVSVIQLFFYFLQAEVP